MPTNLVPPLTVGVCSWSLQVSSVADLVRILGELGVTATQIACGDPHHARWVEGDDFPQVARDSGLVFTGAMLGFPGEDYTTPQTIQRTGGFGDPATRSERLERLRWGIDRTVALGLTDLTLHAGFLPEATHPDRAAMLAALAEAGRMAGDRGVTLAFETGQESALLLRITLDELGSPWLKANFDPANMLLYDMGDPIHAVEILGERIRSVHVKDACHPTIPGQWGQEVPLGQGEVNIPQFLRTLRAQGYSGPLMVEREVGTGPARLADIRAGLELIQQVLSEPIHPSDAHPGVVHPMTPRL